MITAKEAIHRQKHLKSYWSAESRLSQDILIALLSHFESKPKRKPSTYNIFFAKEAKKGLSAQEIAIKWKEKKG